MMAGNPSWWSMQHTDLKSSSASDHQQQEEAAAPNFLISQTHPSINSFLPIDHLHGSSSSSSSSNSSSSMLPFTSLLADHHAQDFPHSWSQLLLGGLGSEQEERFGPSHFQSTRVINSVVDVKQEVSSQSNNNNSNLYGHHHELLEQEAAVNNKPAAAAAAWSQIMPASSPKSCVTSLSSNNILDFSTKKRSQPEIHQHADQSNSECNSTATGGVPKKPRVQTSSTPPLKVRKEKLGDRITALHQLVSPFGKTDTASVFLEAIGYIRFLQGQIEALSSPYMGNNDASSKSQHYVHGERNCLFPDHPGQLLNDSCLKRRGTANIEVNKDAPKDLKSRGLCLVPVRCTQLVANDNGADYWAPSLGGGF